MKFGNTGSIDNKDQSLSLRERGLKSPSATQPGAEGQSLSLRERGLKCKNAGVQRQSEEVALLARAWIEITTRLATSYGKSGRSPCESVD